MDTLPIELKLAGLKRGQSAEHFRLICTTVAEVLPEKARRRFKSCDKENNINSLQYAHEEYISQIVYLSEILPKYIKDAKRGDCDPLLACDTQDHSNFGHECLLSQNKLGKQQKVYEGLMSMDNQEKQRDSDLTDG